MGGSGFFMGAPRRIQEELSSPWKHEVIFEINQLRAFIERRIKTALPDANGDIAVALVTGNKTGISEEIQQTLRVTGLAHILAISGLHMALVTLTVIWLVRGILARFSQLALHYPIKKIAVGAGFFSATFYLLISGGGVATKRAWIMISVMLLAALMDRRAITMRSVAISALFILLLSPQSLLSPGFQMSFAAVASLVAGYEILNKRRKDKNENLIIASKQPHWLIGSFKQILSYFVGIAVTSLIAGTATGFIAAWHFNQIAPLGLIANVLAMPIITIVVMPFVLASVLLMPYGLEYFALIPVAYGIEQVIAIATTIQSYSPAVPIHGLPHISLILFATFLTVLTVLKSKLRYTSLFLLPFIYYTWEKPEIPDIAIAENGRALAVKDEGGNLALLNTRRGSFVTDIWAKNWTQDGFAKIEVDEKSCNRERCVHTLPNNKKLHLVYNPDLLQSSCQTADILLAPRLWWVNCKAHKPELILKRYDFEQFGMHAIYFTSEATKPYRIETGLSKSQRPWQRTVRPIDEVRGNTPWRASGTDE